ncbi:hypothetical protein G6F70_005218 [Rhizopus microsporus]|nr:hypothetical protein G6F71_006528 [Rhizopus microsporus]KAG1199108.1 hypothetical protein G6F70_005218 [Rhizopus microsporus]KAG1209266.1 hypothetical protein G6F69_006501 [Rhizopus microsporus]KAG1230676.1 hypothetical protein G6F67_006293 [Rhizopus microsporus]KAG1262980.1 hypothetical protein G6F68_005517 [Rhizopus microsporus]
MSATENQTINSSMTSIGSPMTKDQLRYCAAIIRNLKKHRDAAPFLNPVDYVKLNVPDYPTVIKKPMDLLLVDQKLSRNEYATVDEFVADVRLIFNNCFKYNGPEAMISVLCQNVESAFEKSLRQMPPHTKELSPPISQNNSPYEETAVHEYYESRPKREIHVPSKDYPEPYTAPATSKAMKYCMQTLREMKKQKYKHLSYPFLYPVDPVALNIPDYPTIVKCPMDMSTIEQKLNRNEYKSPDAFAADIKLMFDNCYLYNPSHLPIYQIAKQFEAVFNEKWAQRPKEEPQPPAKKPASRRSSTKQQQQQQQQQQQPAASSDEDKIAELERHIANISQQIESIKSSSKKSTTSRKRSTPSDKTKKETTPKKKRMTKYREISSDEEDEVMFTFEQKKQLSESINNLSGESLNTIVQIIQSSMPNLSSQGEDEIVLDIDSLDIKTLKKLHEFVNSGTASSGKKAVRKERHHSDGGSSSDSDNNNNNNNNDSDSSSDDSDSD